jgi:tRNA threonylcarbamoyladenosine biosynthesis protein TsaB
MNLLAIDTATEACSVALQVGDAVHARHVEAPREHGERVLGMIDEVLLEAGLDAHQLDLLALGRGPGAFTGVRMGTALVQGIALGLDLPVVRVSTLVTLAQGGWRRHGGDAWLPAIDARMGEVYWGPCRIDAGVAVTVAEECVVAPDGVAVPAAGEWAGIGTGWATYGDVLRTRLGTRCAIDHGHALPVAADMLPAAMRAWEQGEAVSAAAALPTYLRDRVAVPGKVRH